MADQVDTNLEVLTHENALMKKYLALRNKCEQLQQGNEKLVNRIQHVKKLVKRYKRDRRFLQSRLDSYNDSYKEAQVPVMWEEDQMYNLLKPPPQSPTAKDVLPAIPAIPAEVTATPAKPKASKKIKSLLKSHDLSADATGGAGQSLDKMAANLKSLFPVQSIKQEPIELLTSIKQEPMEFCPSNSSTLAFQVFCEQHKQAVQTQYLKEKSEVISSAELTKRLALLWQTMSPEEKRVYYELHELHKQRLEVEARQKEAEASALEAMQLESDAAVSSLLSS